MRTRGTVGQNIDPAKAGRVKALLAEMDGAEFPEWLVGVLPTGWVWPAAVGDSVAIELPDDEDLIEFPQEAECLGVLGNQHDAVPSEFRDDYPHRRGLKTPGGHLLIFDDKGKTITIKPMGGKSEIVCNADGSITVKADSTVKLEAPRVDLATLVTDWLLKGDTVKSAFTSLFASWKINLAAAAPAPTDPNWAAYKTAMAATVTAIEGTLASWLSTKTKTG